MTETRADYETHNDSPYWHPAIGGDVVVVGAEPSDLGAIRAKAAEVRAAARRVLAALTEEDRIDTEFMRMLQDVLSSERQARRQAEQEVRRLRAESEVWEKYSLVRIVKERDALRGLLDRMQRDLWQAEQDCQHWQEIAESFGPLYDELEAEAEQLRVRGEELATRISLTGG